MPENTGRAEALYELYRQERLPYLERARLASLYSIPTLVPPENTNGYSDLYKPWQSIVARCVNNLASRFVLTLFPPNKRNFRLQLTPQAEKQGEIDELSEIEKGLSRAENFIWKEIESVGYRPALFEVYRQLIVAGNCLIYFDPDSDSVRTFSLDRYVVKRKPTGEVVDIITAEKVRLEDLPVEMQIVINQQAGEQQAEPDRTHTMYTHVSWDDEAKTWTVYQECRGMVVPDSEGRLGRTCPYIAARWLSVDGESYSRSMCDDYIGDILLCEGLSKAMAEWAAIAAKVVFMVNPNGLTRPDDLVRANTGEFVPGQKDDITTLGLEKFADFQVVKSVLDDVERRLMYAFLVNSAIQRDAERVTAEEISVMARELEDTLGGVYSLQSREMQLPIVEIFLHRMQKEGTLPPEILERDTVRPTIVTGIDALGRSHELARLDAWLAGSLQLHPEAVAAMVRWDKVLEYRALGLDLDPTELIKSPEERAAEQQQAQQQALMERAAPNAVNAVSNYMQGNNANGG